MTANPNVCQLDRVGMTNTYAERTTQAMTAQEIISAIAGVQALITAGVDSPWCAFLTNENLGKAYNEFSEALVRMARAL